MATEVKLREIFKASLEDDPAVFTKCIELCGQYNLKEEELLYKWEAYASNHHLSADEKLSMKHLDKLTRIIQEQKQPVRRNVRAQEYNKDTVHMLGGGDLLSFYGVEAPVSIAAPTTITAETMDVDEVFEPIVAQPLTRDRKSGQVESYNGHLSEVHSSGVPSDVQVLQHVSRYDYMYDRFEDQVQALARTEQVIGAQLATRYSLQWQNESVEEADVDQELTVLGRVVHRNKDGVSPSGPMTIDSAGIVVHNKAYRLDVLSVPQVVLVPGMRIAVKAVKAHATRLRVNECWTDASLAPSPLVTRNTRVLIAAGPYTARTDLRYEGLDLLFARIRTTAPDVVILLGPFVDAEHPHVQGGAEMVRSVSEEFSALLTRIDQLAAALRHTQFVLVPSLRDAHQPFVYPQPCYSGETQSNNIKMVSNPSVISVNGVRIGISTADILRHMASAELTSRTAGQDSDRIARLLRHVIEQESFYPLYPAHPEVPLHVSKAVQCMFHEHAPHVLVLHSQLQHFAKSVQGVLCVNAGRAVSGTSSGVCAELHLHASTDTCHVAEQTRVNHVYL
jgi:DNA polymerase alpha subunit B